MVNDDARWLHSLILDVFEEQEDAFHFPVRSQKDARAFVKAMHFKGVPYEKIQELIGEFEHNFSSWRSGLGRPGIGARVIDLINSPLVQLLEEEDAYPVNGTFTNGHVSGGAQTTQHRATTSSSSPSSSQLNSTKNHVSGSVSRKPADQPDGRTGTTSSSDSGSQRSPGSGSQASPDSTPASSPESPGAPRVELRRVEPSTTPGSNDTNTTEEEEPPRRMVELRRTPPRQERKERPVSELERMKQQIMNKKQAEQNEKSDVRHSATEDTTDIVTTRLSRSASSVSSGSDTSGSRTPSSAASSETDGAARMETVLGKFDAAIKTPTSPENSFNANTNQNANNAVVLEAPPPRKPDRLFLQESKPATETSSVQKTTENTRILSPEEERREERRALLEETRQQDRTRRVSDGGEERMREEVKREERKEQIKRIKEKYSQVSTSPPGGGNDGNLADVDENYNSDLDPENTTQSPVMATLVKKITAMKAAGKNSSGFIYVLSDSPSDNGSRVRIKVAASRCPRKRVQQARCFNPDARLVASYAVSQRVSALNEVHGALQAFSAGADWFNGAMDHLLGVIEENVCKFPTKTIQNATTDHSES